jgi:HSP20 family molecular chaperone IbpA
MMASRHAFGKRRPGAGTFAPRGRFLPYGILDCVPAGTHIASVGRLGKGPAKRVASKRTAMTRISAFSSPLLLGFDDVERALDRLSKAAGDGYPPYNIERLPKSDGQGDVIRITLAVAGFSAEELDVTVEENELVIRGRQKDEEARSYLHRGIAARQFQKTFVLADGIMVLGADLKDGLLSVDLARPLAEKVVRRIAINRPGASAGPRKE